MLRCGWWKICALVFGLMPGLVVASASALGSTVLGAMMSAVVVVSPAVVCLFMLVVAPSMLTLLISAG